MKAYQNGLAKLVGLFIGLAALFAAVQNTGPASATNAQSPIAVIVPNGKDARSTALFLIGPDGLNAEHRARATKLSEMHTLVIAIDAARLMDSHAGSCDAFAEALEQIARSEQNRQGAFPRTPVLVGMADAASYAVSAAWSAPEKFKGLVTEAAPNTFGLCIKDQTQLSKAPLRWLDVAASQHSAAAGLAGATTVDPGETQRKSFYQSYLRLAGTDSAFDVGTGAGADLSDLPITVHLDNSAPHSDVYAIFLSGDGGWAHFDEEISDRLASRGIPVVGISSLRYMWREKTPTQIAQDFERIDEHFRREFGRSKVVLLGFSLGANTVPFAAKELSTPMRARLAGVGLIAPETHTGFEIVVGGWLGQRTGAIEVAPAIRALSNQVPADRILCLHGRKETVSACPIANVPGMHRVEFEGGHHMGHDHDGVARSIADLAHQNG